MITRAGKESERPMSGGTCGWRVRVGQVEGREGSVYEEGESQYGTEERTVCSESW